MAMDDRWRKEVLEWYLKECKRMKGRLREKWVDELKKMFGVRWMRLCKTERRGIA